MKVRTKLVLAFLGVAMITAVFSSFIIVGTEIAEERLVVDEHATEYTGDHLTKITEMFFYLKLFAVGASFAILILASFTGIYFAHSISVPLERLRDVLSSLSKGEMDVTIPDELLERDDELGDLARAFDRTMVSLKLAMERTEEGAKEKVDSMQDELTSMEAQLTSALDVASEGFLVVDTDGHVQLFNDRFAEIWSLSEEEVEEGIADEKLRERVHERLADPQRFEEELQELYANPSMEKEDTIELADGTIVERHTKPHKEAGEIVGRIFRFRVMDANRDNGT